MSVLRATPGGDPVAIVGIGCRLPGGVTDAKSFWDLLSEGRDAIIEIPSNRIDVQHYFDPRPATPGRMMSRWGGFLDHIDEFDADFFGISPREAERLDPAQRLLLETAWEALEDAGHDVCKLEGTSTGVFIGQWTSDFEARLFADPEAVDFYMAQGSGRYASSGRISYVLGLRGPSLTLDTACSSSLVAIHLAVRSIRSGESTMALAGGANIILQPQINIAYSESRMIAADGRCKFGDASGDGYVRSEGVALVVLKSLGRAIADGDRIYAVIRGSSINNDGSASGSMGTPSRIGQEELLRSAYRDAGLSGGEVDYIEAHGTGTRAGDPVEFVALAAVLGEGREQGHHAFVGSLKTNLGHTEAAAGVAGVIKTALALHHNAIPPSLHHKTPNPLIPWADLPLAVPRTLVAWPRHDGPRLAGVSGFGIAGTNAHVVLEEAPAEAAESKIVRRRSTALLPLSAKSPEALRAHATRVADLLEPHAGPALYDVCWNAATRRTPLGHRAVFVATDRPAMVDSLRRYADGAAAAAQGVVHGDMKPKIAFVCPGQGAQWAGMARLLLEQEPEFLSMLERCDQAARPYVDWSIIEQLSAEPGTAAHRLDQIDVIQPVLVAMTIAYAALWRSRGVEPDAVVGHSMGEVASACIAGVLNLDQAMHIICRRSALMRRISGQGAMALVDLSMEEAGTRLAGREDQLSVAVSNSPRSSVISGDPAALQHVMAELERDDVFCRLVKVDVASHSPQMDPLARELSTDLIGLALGEARIPIWSTLLGRRAESYEFDAAYWGCNLRQTVRFTDAVSQLLEDGVSIFVELGPHPILLQSVQQTAQSIGHEAVTVACGLREEGDQATALTAFGQLWAAGYPVEWERVMPERGYTVSLPLYPWQRERYWVEAAEIGLAAVAREKSIKPDDESLGWLHQLRWELSDIPAAQGPSISSWLVLSSDTGLGAAIVATLASRGANASAASLEDIEKAIEEFLQIAGSSYGIILIASDGPDTPYLPIRTLQSILDNGQARRPLLWLVTRGGQSVNGYESRVSVDQGAMWGAARVIGEEHPDIWGGLVDLDPSAPSLAGAALLVRHILSRDGEDQIALRAERRFVLRLVSGHGERPKAFQWRPDSAYLITGGLGDIGRHVAHAMAAQGCRRLVLIGRTPLPPRVEWNAIALESEIGRRIAGVRGLEALGVAVQIATLDVSDETQLSAFLDGYKSEGWPPIRGVIHTAAVLENGLAATMDRATFDVPMGAKLRAAQLLDRMLPDLDLFVLFSSIPGFLAHSGVANYAAANAGLDALAQDRRARGLPGLSIAWGVWQDTGLVKGPMFERIIAEFKRQGIEAFSADRGTRLFIWACGLTDSRVAVLPVDWAAFQQARPGREYPMLRNLVAGVRGPAISLTGIPSKLLGASLAERRQLLDGIARDVIARVLNLPPSRVDARKAFGTMGLTSLMAMELRNRLEAALDRPLSATLAWNYPTLEALVDYLSKDRREESNMGSPASRDIPVQVTDQLSAIADLSDEEAIAALRR